MILFVSRQNRFVNYVKVLTLIIFAKSCLSLSSESELWKYTVETDGFTDKEVHRAKMLQANNSYIDIICNEHNDFSVFVSNGEFITIRDCPVVKYRFDKEVPITSRMCPSAKGTSVYLSGTEAEKFVNKISKSSSILIEIKDYLNTPHTTMFYLTGSSAAISKTLHACQIAGPDRDQVINYKKAVPSAISKIGPIGTKCMKKRLSALGYKIDKINDQKSLDLYMSLQSYVVDTQEENNCTTDYSFRCKPSSIINSISIRLKKADKSVYCPDHYYGD